MELPQLVVELVGDYSKLMEDIKKARVEAIKQAQFLEKDLNLTIGVNDDSLKNLNKHFDLKVTHFKQTQTYFKNNPLKVFVDDGELTNLNKEFKKSSTTKQKVTRVVEVDETVVINNNKKSTSNNSDSGGKKESIKDVVDELKKGFADIRKQIRDQATGEVLKILAKPAKDFMTGFSEGIANDFGKQVSKGLRTVFAKQLGLDFKKMGEMAGESLLDAFGIKRKKTTKEKPPTSTTPENNSSVGEPLAKPSPKKRKEPEPVFESISVKVAKQNARNFSNNVRNAATVNNNINPGEISSTVLSIKSAHQSLHKVLIDLMKNASNSGDFSIVEKIYKEYQIKSKEALAEVNRLIALAKKNGATQEEINKLSQAKSPITRAAGKSSQLSQTYQKTKREAEKFEIVKDAVTGMGLDAIAGLKYGLDNKAFAKFGLQNATAYLLSIRDAFQIKSPSKVMFSIGKNIIQGLIGGLDQAFPGVQAQVKRLFDSLTKDFVGFKVSKLFDSGISGAVKYLATSAKKAIFSNTTDAIGNFAEEKLKPSVANFVKNSVNKTKSSSKNTPLDYIKGLVGDAGSLISDNKNEIKDFFTAKNFLNLGNKAAPFAINSVIKKPESLKSILGLVGIDSEKVNIGKGISDYFGDLINKTFKPIIEAQSGKLKSATTDFFQAIKNALSDAKEEGELTLGELFQFVATAGATSILSSLGVKTGGSDFVSALISMLSGGSKGGFMAKLLPLIAPMLGLKSLNLGETIVKILSGNSAIKPGFLMDVFRSITGVNLKQTPGFDTFKNMVGVGTKIKERLGLENVNNKQIQENLKNINLSGGTTGLINNFGQTIIKEVLKNLGITGIKAGVMQGMANEQLAKFAPEISKMLGKGRLEKLMSGYTTGNVDSISQELNDFAQSKGIKNLNVSQIKGFVGTALAAITGLQARFNKEGFALGNNLAEGFKNSKRNWLNSIDDATYAAKKALGQANMQDVGENVKKRMSRGSVVPVEMFDEFYGHLGRTVKKAISPKGSSKSEQDILGADAVGGVFSHAAFLAPIQVMATAIAPLFLPLLPIIQVAKMMADSLFPYVNKLVDMAQRVEPIQRQLNFAGGGSLGGKAELDYVRSVGKKYSTSVEFGAGAYGQLQVAARGTKMAGEGVRELYEGISASLNKLGIAGQEQSLIFMAYTQMLSKGRVSMEELRQQLGEKFPPAMSVFAKAMGLSIPAMVEMVSNGGVLSDEVLPKVGKVLLSEFGGVANSVNSVIDALARLSNAGFDIAVGLTDSFGGVMAGVINVLTGGLTIISNSISAISNIVSASLITMGITAAVGLRAVLQVSPLAAAIGTIQNFLMSSFRNITLALAPFFLGIVVDFADTMVGAQKDLRDNMFEGFKNMIVGGLGILEKVQRDIKGIPLFGDVIGKEAGKNPLSGLIDGVKSLTKILPSGLVELAALTFMIQSIGALINAPLVMEGLGTALGGMIDAVVSSVKSLWTSASGLRVLFANTATMNFGDFIKREAMINAAMGARVALMEKLRVAAMALASVMATVGFAFLVLSFAKGDFTNPLGDSVGKMARGVNDSISTMKSSLAELAEKFKSVGDSAENAAKKFIQLPSKGAELNPQYLLGLGGRSIKFDDVVNKGDKQDGLRSNLSAFLTNIFTPVDESKTPVLRVWDKIKPLFGRRNQQEDVKKALAEAKSYGIEEFFTGKESFLNISKSQTLGAFKDVRSSVKGFEKELNDLGLLGGEKELLAKNKDLEKQINIIKDIDKKLITLGKERQVLAQRRDSKSIIKVGELDKKAVDLQVQRDKELKPLSRFSSAAKQATTFVEELRDEINKSTAPLQLKIKLLDEIKPLEDFAKKASENVKKYLPVNFAENNYKQLAAGLKDAQINYETAKNNAEINLSGRQKDLYSSNNLPGQISYESNLAQIAEQEAQVKNLSTILSVRINTLKEMSAIINVDREQDQKKEMDDLKKQIADDGVGLGKLTSDIAKSKFDLIQSLYQQTKQVTDYYRVAVRESQAVGIEFEKAQKTFENSKVQNKLREALIGAGDNIYTQFIEGIINVISQTTEIEKQQLEARKQRIDYQNNVQDIQLQAIELQRSLPGKIIPIDSSIADNFNLSLKNVNRTVDEINKNINNLSNSVVDATKKAEDSIKDLSKTSNSWIEGLGTKFADLVKSFENGFDRVGTAITDMGIKTSNWLASLATGQGLLQNLAGGVQSAVSTVFGEKAGQQLEQGAKEFVSNPIGALKQFYGVDNNSTPSTRLKAKGKVGFVENSSSSIDSARGHIGDDIFAPIGSKIFSPLAGTVVQSRVGGTKNTDDANPLVPGYQPQQLVIIKLDMPIEFEGKKITHLNMRHLLDRNVQVGQKVKTGDLLGTVGEAGGRGTQFGTRNPGTARDADAAHLHIEYAPSENNQRNSLPDSQASRLTAKLSKEYSGGVQNTVNTPKTSRNRQPVPKVPLVPGLDPRIDTKFLQSVSEIAQSVGANPEDLLKTMLYETGGTLSPSARNKRTNATGLIQFMPATARGLGTNIDALSQMSPQEQLVFVQKYLKQNSRGQKLDSFRKVLSTVFAGNPNASLGVGDGDITLGNYLPKAENRYGNTARQLVQIVMQGGSIQPNQMQQAVTQASRLKLNTAAQQYQTNQINSNLNPEQIKENELKQRLEAYRLIMSSQKGAIGDISSTKDSTLGTKITVLKGLSPTMSNADMFSLQFNELRRKLEKDVELLKQIIRETDGAIAQKPDLQAAFNLAMKRFPNDPRLAEAAIQTNDLSFKATAFKNAEAKNSLKFLESNIDSILKASMKDFDKKEFFRLSEQDISQQSKVIEQLQQQLQLVQKLEEIDPLNPLVLKIPSLQRNISLLELTRDQYQQLLDLQRRYYDGGGKGGNMSEAAFQKEFKAILNVNSVKREGVDLNFNYADTVKRIKQANDELTKSQTIQASQMKSLQLDNERFAIDNKDGMVSLVSLTNELTIKTNELTNAYKKQLLEIQGNTLLSPQEKLIERLKAFRNYGKEKSNLDAENSYQTKLAPITNRGIELGRMEKLNSSGSAISSEIIRGRGLFGVRDKELQKTQLLSQIKMDFEKEKNEIAKLGLSSNYSAEEISVLSENLLKLNELKLDNVAKEFNMFTEAISGIKGDFDNILKGFFMNDSVNKNAGDLQDINKSLDEIAKKRRDIIMNTSGNIQEVRNAYQNSGNNKQLKELDRAQRDLEKKKTELSKRSIVDAFSEIAKSILSNLAAVASKELSNQLFGKLTEIIFGNKAKDVGAIALNNAGANLSMSATMLQQAALALQNIMGAGSKDGGVLDSIFGAFGESSFGVLEGSSAIPFSSSGAFDFSDGFSLGGLDGGLDFGSATLPSFAKGGMVGDLLNKERAISGFNPRLIIANEGERVLTPKETKLWNQLNSSNKLESFSSGGMIGEGLGNINNVGRSGDTINITPNVNINNSEGGNGNINKALFEKALEAKIQETIKQERRPGGSLNRGGLYDR
jgi:tape measure domain-containing protein